MFNIDGPVLYVTYIKQNRFHEKIKIKINYKTIKYERDITAGQQQTDSVVVTITAGQQQTGSVVITITAGQQQTASDGHDGTAGLSTKPVALDQLSLPVLVTTGSDSYDNTAG